MMTNFGLLVKCLTEDD